MLSPKLVERLGVEHARPQIGDGGIQFFGRLVKALHEARRAARDLLKVERRLAFHVGVVGQHRQRVGGRDHGNILVAEKAGLLDDKPRVVVNRIILVDLQSDGDVVAARQSS